MDAASDRPDDAVTQTATPVGDVRAPVRMEAAATIGRFTVLGMLGVGGMGQVFSAYDPQLDRRVALKLLHGEVSTLERQRLLREAQALARVTHPNVVTVHEVGAHEGHVYVAMEYVQGTTLREWMDAHPLGEPGRLQRALELLRDAGRGIEAAHAAGLVHRDVKPRNILVGDDGRVRVVDFGLARSSGTLPVDDMLSTNRAHAASSHDLLDTAGASPSSPLLEETLTQTGSIIGTPAYMAPEQYRPGDVEPAADQFALCVTAWEVLFGVRPFRGPPLAMLAAIRDGKMERPAGIELPDGLEEALRRGLSHRRGRRHPDMGAVIDALTRALAQCKGDPMPRLPAKRSRVWMVGLVGAAAASAFWLGGRDAVDCDGGDAHVAGLWSEPRRQAIEAAVTGVSADFAAGVWTRLAEHVPRWQQSWVAAHRDACEATHVRHEQSEHVMDLRMACLDDRRVAMEGYLERLADGTVDAIANADEAFARLPAIDRCADAEYVQSRGHRSEDPEVAAVEAAVLAEVAKSETLLAAGDYDGALELAREAVAMASDAEWARAYALLAEGRALAGVDPAAAIEPLEAAHSLAQVHELPEVAARSSLELVNVLGMQLQALSKAMVWLPIAEADAQRLGDPNVEIVLNTFAARVLKTAGELDRARTSIDLAFGEIEESGSDGTIMHARALRTRSSLELDLSGVDDARAALDLAQSILGATHPELTNFHMALGAALSNRVEMDAAIREYELALAIAVNAVGETHPRTARALVGLADVRLSADRYRDARRTAERAVQIMRTLGIEDITLVHALSELAEAEVALGDVRTARDHFQLAYELSKRLLGDREAETARHLMRLGALEGRLGEHEPGTIHFGLGLALAEDLVESRAPASIEALDLVASGALAEGRVEEAYAAYLELEQLARRDFASDLGLNFAAALACCEAAHGLGKFEDAVEHCDIARARARDLALNPRRLAYLEITSSAVLIELHRLDEAADLLARALTRLRGSDAIDGAMPIALANLAEIRLMTGDPSSAKMLYLESVDAREAIYHARHQLLVTPLVGASSAALALGEVREAVELAQRSLDIAEDGGDPKLLAKAQEAVVLARWQQARGHKARAELRASMQEALATYEAQGERASQDTARVRSWLAAH